MFTARNSSCGKVMFSQASFNLFARGISLVQFPFGGAVRYPGRDMVSEVGGIPYSPTPTPPRNHKSERYASYWNAFLLHIKTPFLFFRSPSD